MSMTARALQIRAVQVLVFCTVLWGVSFPASKALFLAQASLVPGVGSLFLASSCLFYRFAIAAIVIAVLAAPTWKRITRREVQQGVALGLFGGIGILLQMDGLAHTLASTSAFLTQCTCIFIPLWVACRHRVLPSRKVALGCALVIVGVAVLAGLNWRALRLGRGELETILAAVAFTGQILMLERPAYAGNNLRHFTGIMFAVMSLGCLPVAVAAAPNSAAWIEAYRIPATWVLLAILIVPCTLGAYVLMNQWQRHVTATQAGLIYCLEPVFASVCAMVLPGIFSQLTGHEYLNEVFTFNLAVGGSLITLANVVVQWPERRLSPGSALPAPTRVDVSP
jgi:drug/metabolite transporter (DMT)-like permease